MKKIILTRGYEALVDDEDFEGLNRFKWYADGQGKDGRYVRASRQSPRGNGRQTKIYMHRQILGAPHGSVVDHEDHDTLNNQRCNIRVTSYRSNMGNEKLRSDNTSGYKGVCWKRQCQRWGANILVDDKRKHLGYFDTSLKAALAYDTAVRLYRDAHATTNQSLGLL